MRLIDADKVLLNNMEILLANGSFKDALEIQLEKIEKAPTVEAIPIDKPFLKMKYKGYTVYKTEWLKEHIEMEYRVIKGISASKAEAIPIEWIKKWLENNIFVYKNPDYIDMEFTDPPIDYYLKFEPYQVAQMLKEWEEENGKNG